MGPQNDVTLKMPAFEWVHVQLHQQKGMISLSPPTICNSASAGERPDLLLHLSRRRQRRAHATALVAERLAACVNLPARPAFGLSLATQGRGRGRGPAAGQDQCRGLPRPAGTPAPTASLRTPGAARGRSRTSGLPEYLQWLAAGEPTGKLSHDRIHDPACAAGWPGSPCCLRCPRPAVAQTSNCRRSAEVRPVRAGQCAGPHEVRWRIADAITCTGTAPRSAPMPPSPARPWRCRRARPTATNSSATSKPTARNCSAPHRHARAAGASATTLTVKYRIADAGVCYPPQTRTLKAALPGEAGAGGFGCKARGLHDYVVKNGSADHPNAEVKFALGDGSTP